MYDYVGELFYSNGAILGRQENHRVRVFSQVFQFCSQNVCQKLTDMYIVSHLASILWPPREVERGKRLVSEGGGGSSWWNRFVMEKPSLSQISLPG